VRGVVVDHFRGWTIGGVIEAEHRWTVAEPRQAVLPMVQCARPTAPAPGGVAHAPVHRRFPVIGDARCLAISGDRRFACTAVPGRATSIA
jgi:hypothetical protein